MNARSFFEVGKHNIVQTGRNFDLWFGDMSVSPSVHILHHTDITEYLSTDDIIRTLKPVEVTLDDVAYCVLEKKDLIKDKFNIFFVRDNKKVFRVIDVYWSELGWCVCSRALEDPRRCIVGRVFSAIPFEK